MILRLDNPDTPKKLAHQLEVEEIKKTLPCRKNGTFLQPEIRPNFKNGDGVAAQRPDCIISETSLALIELMYSVLFTDQKLGKFQW